MASPSAKRRKIDDQANQSDEGYDTLIFLNSVDANRHLCVICQCVYKEPYNIGCENEHIFCKNCLHNYFIPINTSKSCPSCRQQGLSNKNIKPSRIIQRLVNSLKVKCPLQLEQNINSNQCLWNGELSDLNEHINIRCPLGNINCDYCCARIKKYQLTQHESICFEKPVPCDLKCGNDIKRGLIQKHQNNKCPMKILLCDYCKQKILRKNMQDHVLIHCPEYQIKCLFNKYGCYARIKRKLMDNHLKEREIEHLKLKVNKIENELVMVKKENECYEMRIKCLETPAPATVSNKDKLLLLLKSKTSYVSGIQSGKTQQIEIGSFMNEGHFHYCIGNDIRFNEAKQIGFNTKEIKIITNDIVFGLSENKISALSLRKPSVCKTFNGNTPIGYIPIYCNNYGLMIVGGMNVNGTIPNRDIYKIVFNNNTFTTQSFTKLPYSTVCPSVCMINENNNNNNLFVCGGWWNKHNLSKCYLYSFNNNGWKELKYMNYSRQCSGICVWKERGNKIVVGGGYEDVRFVEEYDMHKNQWINLPNLNERHVTYPTLITLNNILFCIGGVSKSDCDLGHIELYDPRDQSNKWIYIETVQKYFNIPNDTGAGANCFLPL